MKNKKNKLRVWVETLPLLSAYPSVQAYSALSDHLVLGISVSRASPYPYPAPRLPIHGTPRDPLAAVLHATLTLPLSPGLPTFPHLEPKG